MNISPIVVLANHLQYQRYLLTPLVTWNLIFQGDYLKHTSPKWCLAPAVSSWVILILGCQLCLILLGFNISGGWVRVLYEGGPQNCEHWDKILSSILRMSWNSKEDFSLKWSFNQCPAGICLNPFPSSKVMGLVDQDTITCCQKPPPLFSFILFEQINVNNLDHFMKLM